MNTTLGMSILLGLSVFSWNAQADFYSKSCMFKTI